MKERETKKTLHLTLFISIIFILISTLQVVVNTLQDRPNWLVALLFLPIPIFVFIAIVILLDLAKQDYLTLQGRLTTKSGSKVVVTTVTGRDQKFRITNNQMNEIKGEVEIEIRYYKRTRAVISIKKYVKETRDM